PGRAGAGAATVGRRARGGGVGAGRPGRVHHARGGRGTGAGRPGRPDTPRGPAGRRVRGDAPYWPGESVVALYRHHRVTSGNCDKVVVPAPAAERIDMRVAVCQFAASTDVPANTLQCEQLIGDAA